MCNSCILVGLIENLNDSEPTVERPLWDQEVLFIRVGPVKSLGESVYMLRKV
jgi:hypothetical protein